MENKRRLLIVENGDLNRIVYKALMSKHFNVTMCESKTEFYNALEKDDFDIFLCTCQGRMKMPPLPPGQPNLSANRL